MIDRSDHVIIQWSQDAGAAKRRDPCLGERAEAMVRRRFRSPGFARSVIRDSKASFKGTTMERLDHLGLRVYISIDRQGSDGPEILILHVAASPPDPTPPPRGGVRRVQRRHVVPLLLVRATGHTVHRPVRVQANRFPEAARLRRRLPPGCRRRFVGFCRVLPRIAPPACRPTATAPTCRPRSRAA